uniref:Uncharacterized protein n=1 Tax=Anguilla anguilla TaxID=7936 RepID=A0A0E9XQ84_ANGAN
MSDVLRFYNSVYQLAKKNTTKCIVGTVNLVNLIGRTLID